jgi:hypothetical protein
LYAQVGSEQPIPMVKIEGMESYRVFPLEDGSYEILGNMLTFFRDIDTGKMIQEYQNPFTGKINEVLPNIRQASIGRGLNISTMGARPKAFIDQMPDKPWNGPLALKRFGCRTTQPIHRVLLHPECKDLQCLLHWISFLIKMLNHYPLYLLPQY